MDKKLVGVFIKVFDKEIWADNFLNNGEMLFSHISVMRDIDNNARRDNYEGETIENLYVNIDKNMRYLRIDNTHCIDLERLAKDGNDIREQNACLRINYIPDYFIYSFANINEMNENISDAFNELKKFGNYAVVIVNCPEFIRRVKSFIKGSELYAIKYTTEPSNMYEKRTIYKNENDSRIGIDAENLKKLYGQEKRIKLYVGSLQDIAFKCNVNQFDDFVKRFENSASKIC